MKIGIYDPYLDTLGGGEKYMLSIAECLSNDNTVVVFWNDKRILSKAEEKFGLDLKKIKIQRNIFVKTSRITRFLKSLGFDAMIVLSDGSVPTIATKKLFIHFQAPLKKENISTKTKAKLSTKGKIIVNSKYTKKYIDQAFGKDSFVIYPPVEVDAFTNKEKKENTILTVGRYSPLPTGDFKKHSEMIIAFKEMCNSGLKGWSFKMVVSTRSEDKSKVEELKTLTSSYPITIYQSASHKQITEMYKSAKIYWHAAGLNEDLDISPDRAEHFGISVVEAMAAGAVPVVFSAGGPKEIVKNDEFGYTWNTLAELKEKTLKLVSNEKLRQSLETKGRDEAKKYTKEMFCKQINTFIK